jgi:hypothetical protein
MDLTDAQKEALEAEREQLERQALFAICISREHLKLWIKKFLGIDLPDAIVCDDDITHEPSNSSPLDLIWEVYQKALEGTDEEFQRVLAYAARDSFKTLSASILEVLCLFHLRRNVAHMAAIESQAQKAASYLNKYLNRPYLKDYVEGNNKREVRVTRYESLSGEILTPDEFKALTNKEQRRYEPISQYMKIIIATLSGANSEHVSFMVLDELDLAPEAPLQEAKFIPAPGEVRGELPITFMTSSRKFAFGNVQKELNKAVEDKDNHLQVRHWNILDVTQACPPTRHLPEEPRIPIYYSEHTLKAIGEPDYYLLAPEERTKYFRQEGYSGCLKKCSIFAVCRGRLASKQTGTSKMLKPIPHVSNVLKDASVEHAKAQLMCWKPSAEGLIYPHFQYSRHMLDPVAMYEKITGEEIPRKMPDGTVHPDFIEFAAKMTKSGLIQFMRDRGMEFFAGMDFGYTHNWAVITGARDGHRLFVFDVIAIAGLELMEKIDMFKAKLEFLDPTVYPDPAYPSDIKTFRRHGVRMKDFKKDVLGGIEAVRAKILPGMGKEPEIFFLATDDGCELLARRLSEYHWKVDANQKATDIPDDKDDDECDALRYLCQNLFGTKGRFHAAIAGISPLVNYDPAFPNPYRTPAGMRPEDMRGITVHDQETIQGPTTENWMQREIQQRTGGNTTVDESGDTQRQLKKGNFICDL